MKIMFSTALMRPPEMVIGDIVLACKAEFLGRVACWLPQRGFGPRPSY
jgi:hypothetical protein